jgi:uncharacterized protein YndB with AHSA1/START domain
MLKKIGIIVLAILAVFLGYVALQPSHYEISRQTTIHAPAEKIFPYLNSSKLAEQWGPWLEVDPQAKMTYSGPDQGVGSRSSWESTGHLGFGSATITESEPNRRVALALEYTKPMPMSQYSEYILQNTGPATTVIWKVQGENSFMGRLMCVFMNMDKMVGSMFEKGLLNLKTLVEKH